MKWSWKFGRLFGIDLYVHATFFLLLVWVAFAAWAQTHDPMAAVGGVLFILAVFASVVLHEYGHALTARRFGVTTRDIILLPIGGVARLERMPDEPKQELAIAIAGPLVTLAIVIVLYALARLSGLSTAYPRLGTDVPFVTNLMWTNAIILVFNLVPAFPMDGGRVLRALIAHRTGLARATEIAAQVGKIFALLFGIVGLFGIPGLFPPGNIILVLIALFVWLGAAGEASMIQTRTAFDGVPVAQVMITDMVTLTPGDPLDRAVQAMLSGFQQDFPVVEGDRVVGVLTRGDLLQALARHEGALTVGDVMRRNFDVTAPEEPLGAAFARLQASRAHTLPVLHGQRLVGVLTAENVGEFMMVRAARRDGHV